MDIAVSGMTGAGLLAPSAASGKDSAGFAAVLVSFGAEAPAAGTSKVSFAMPTSSDAQLVVGAVALTVKPSVTPEAPLLPALPVPQVSSPAAEGDTQGTTPEVQGRAGDATALVDDASAAPAEISPAAPANQDVAIELAIDLDVAHDFATDPDVALELASHPDVALELATSSKEVTVPLGSQAEETAGWPAVQTGHELLLTVSDIPATQIAAAVRPVRSQDPNSELAEVIDGVMPTHSLAGEPLGTETTNADAHASVDGRPDPFARILRNAGHEQNSAPEMNVTREQGSQPASPASANAAPASNPSTPPAIPLTAALPGALPQAVEQQSTIAAAQVPAEPDSHTHPVMAFRADKVAREMGLEIAKRVSAGGEELVIRLDPAEMGRINIRMTVNEQGQLRAVVSADLPAVVDALRGDLAELSRALEQAGVRTDSQSFRFDRGNSGDPGGTWQQRYPQQQQNETGRGSTGGLAMGDEDPAYRPLATNGHINMMA